MAPSRSPHGWWLLVGIVAGGVLLDQVTKGLVRAHIPPGDALTVIPGCFDLVHGQNTGIVFGLFRAVPGLFKVLNLLTVPLLLWGYVALPLTRGGQVAWSAIIAGAVGNSIDRVAIGHVTDFIDWYLGSYHWYAFNVADACILVGVIAIIGFNLLLPTPVPPASSDVSDPV